MKRTKILQNKLFMRFDPTYSWTCPAVKYLKARLGEKNFVLSVLEYLPSVQWPLKSSKNTTRLEKGRCNNFCVRMLLFKKVTKYLIRSNSLPSIETVSKRKYFRSEI